MADLINWASKYQEDADYEADQEARRQAEAQEEADRWGRSTYGYGRRLQEWTTPEEPTLGRHLSLAETAKIAADQTEGLDVAVMEHYQECDECRRMVRRAEEY